MQTSLLKASLATAIFAIAFAPSVCNADDQKDIVDTAVGAGSFKTLVAAVQAAELVDALKGDGPFTVFAPTDDAFANLPAGTVEALLKPENRDQLVSILTYHVVPGSVKAEDVVALHGAVTLNGQQIDIDTSEGVKVDAASVVVTDIECSNGVIHVIDSVLLPASKTIPETAAAAGTFQTLLAAVTAADLAEVLSGDGPFTVFAPTDEAFASLPEGTLASLLEPGNKQQLIDILKYHVVSGRVYSDQALSAGEAATLLGREIHIVAGDDGAKVNDASLVATDIDASNGVIHVIDSVLIPANEPAQTSATSSRKPCPLSTRATVTSR